MSVLKTKQAIDIAQQLFETNVQQWNRFSFSCTRFDGKDTAIGGDQYPPLFEGEEPDGFISDLNKHVVDFGKELESLLWSRARYFARISDALTRGFWEQYETFYAPNGVPNLSNIVAVPFPLETPSGDDVQRLTKSQIQDFSEAISWVHNSWMLGVLKTESLLVMWDKSPLKKVDFDIWWAVHLTLKRRDKPTMKYLYRHHITLLETWYTQRGSKYQRFIPIPPNQKAQDLLKFVALQDMELWS